ncbi:MAG: hypothetical protein ABIQ44_02145 [Chloroflexia bacterium]
MHSYCLYQIDPTGQIRRLLEFEAQYGVSGIARAENVRTFHAMQLWSLGQIVRERPAVANA